MFSFDSFSLKLYDTKKFTLHFFNCPISTPEKTLFRNLSEKMNYIDKLRHKRLCIPIVQKQQNINRSIRRAKDSIIEFALQNPFLYFGTITIDSQKWDTSAPEIILDALLKWLNRYKDDLCPDFIRIVVPEYGEKRGRLHFHFLFGKVREKDLFINEYGYLDFRPLREKFGWVQITKIKDTDDDKNNVAAYCSKYMSKDNIQIRSHRFFASQGLKRAYRFVLYCSSASSRLFSSTSAYMQEIYGSMYGVGAKGFKDSLFLFRDDIKRCLRFCFDEKLYFVLRCLDYMLRGSVYEK